MKIKHVYTVKMRRNGDAHVMRFNVNGIELNSVRFIPSIDAMYTTCEAEDEDHAEAIAEARRQHVLREGKWGSPEILRLTEFHGQKSWTSNN